MNGRVGIGFNHPKEGFVKVKDFFKNSYIGAYNLLSGLKSEFWYEAKEKTMVFSLEKNFFFEVMEKYPEILSWMKGNQMKQYQICVRDPIKVVKKQKQESITDS